MNDNNVFEDKFEVCKIKSKEKHCINFEHTILIKDIDELIFPDDEPRYISER